MCRLRSLCLSRRTSNDVVRPASMRCLSARARCRAPRRRPHVRPAPARCLSARARLRVCVLDLVCLVCHTALETCNIFSPSKKHAAASTRQVWDGCVFGARMRGAERGPHSIRCTQTMCGPPRGRAGPSSPCRAVRGCSDARPRGGQPAVGRLHGPSWSGRKLGPMWHVARGLARLARARRVRAARPSRPPAA